MSFVGLGKILSDNSRIGLGLLTSDWHLVVEHARSRPTGAPPTLSVPDLGLGHQSRLESSQGRSNAADRVCAAAATLLCVYCVQQHDAMCSSSRTGNTRNQLVRLQRGPCMQMGDPSSRLLAVSPKRGNCQRLSFSFLLGFWSELGIFIFEH